MSLYDTIRRFKLLSGLEDAELSRYSDLCKEAFDEIKALFKRRVRGAIEAGNRKGESNRDDYGKHSNGLG